ncbi:MAG: L,D-transpeptidase [Proteobacteria bacterium]|nr:L,D-transpeptidase [Pseudomonadota bacterium]
MSTLRELAAAAAVLSVAMAGAVVAQSYATPAAPPPVAKLVPKPVHEIPTLVAAARATPATPLAIARQVSPATDTAHPLPKDAVAEKPLAPRATKPDPATLALEAGQVAQRISEKVPAAIAPYFNVFIYVSKASHGPWAQRLFLFHKDAGGQLVYEESFAVSTGRERAEQYFTATPTGLFELDSHRFVRNARSGKWNDAPMPWAMFLNYSYRTQMSGVALHAAIGARELSMIGQRASGGCVRLPIDKAEAFFRRFQADERGQVPVFAFDEKRGTTNVDGITVHDDAGNIMLADGVRVLVVIDGYGGGATEPSQS